MSGLSGMNSSGSGLGGGFSTSNLSSSNRGMVGNASSSGGMNFSGGGGFGTQP